MQKPSLTNISLCRKIKWKVGFLALTLGLVCFSNMAHADYTQGSSCTAKAARGYGFIAQDIEPLLLDLLSRTSPGVIVKAEGLEEPKDGFLELNYDGLIAPLVKALQEQEMDAKQQDLELERLQKSDDELRKSIAVLENSP